eukprot:6191146-Pleurochrysis_carterae.AAC.1
MTTVNDTICGSFVVLTIAYYALRSSSSVCGANKCLDFNNKNAAHFSSDSICDLAWSLFGRQLIFHACVRSYIGVATLAAAAAGRHAPARGIAPALRCISDRVLVNVASV